MTSRAYLVDWTESSAAVMKKAFDVKAYLVDWTESSAGGEGEGLA